MLVLLLSVSVVFCSPAQLPTVSNHGQNGEDFPSASTSSPPVDDTAASFSSKGQRKYIINVSVNSKDDTPDNPSVTQREKRIIAVGDHVLKNSNMFSDKLINNPSLPIHPPKDGHITSEVRTVALEISEQPPEKFVFPPIRVFQHASEINLEPTEVEAPGTTPTTVAMVTKSILAASRETTNKNPEILEPARFNVRYIQRYTSNKSDRIIMKPKTSIIEHLSVETTTHKNSFSELSQSQDQITTIPVATNDSLSKVNTNSESNNYGEIITPTRRDFKIKTRNNTYTLVHETDFQKLKQSGGGSPVRGSITETTHKNNAKRITKTEQLTNNTSPKNVHILEKKDHTTFDTLSLAEDQEFETKSSNLQTTPFLSEQVETTTYAGYLSQNDEIAFLNDDARAKDYKQTSVIQTREVDNESYFRSVDAPIGTRVVKKDELDASKWHAEHSNKNPYDMDSITSSSELSYKQFDLKNVSQFQSNLQDSKNSETKISKSEDSNINFSQGENPFSSSVMGNVAGHETSSAHREKNKDERTVSEQISVTSLPRQTSVVEPLKTNSSSPLSEVTLPSAHHRTKSDENSNSHSVSSSINVKIVGPYAVGVYPEKAAGLAVSEASSVLQERVSVPLSAHVNQRISSGSVAAIVIGVLLSMALVGGAAAYIVYQRLEGFRPKILSSDRSCANSDSGGYLDDQCTVAYVNSQLDIPKSTPEDLVSLDNDSFLNSLESMTIQNLWTDSIRHTKL